MNYFGDTKFLITGISSIHGWPIFNYFTALYPDNVLGIKTKFAKKPCGGNILSANIEDKTALKKIFNQFAPDCVIHCGGLCDLDKAEEHPEYAYKLNVEAAKYLRRLSHNIRMVYLSYDLVYSGIENDGAGYREEQIPDPLTVVGKTILQTEKVLLELPGCLIVRLGLPLGDSVQGCKGAVDWINYRFKNNRVATLLYDEIRSTINTEEIGPALHELMLANCRGLYHLGSKSTISIYGIGERLIKCYNHPPHLLEGKMRWQFPLSPPRMGNVSLNSSKAYRVLNWIPQPWRL